MGLRALRRQQQKQERKDTITEHRRRARKEQKETEDLVLEAMREAEEYTKHHITGELYTAAAVVLSGPPYRWPEEKVLRFLDKVGGIINDLNDKVICDADLVREGEKCGIRVLWDASHKYIEGISEFEEEKHEE